jgi:hypothetical protein
VKQSTHLEVCEFLKTLEEDVIYVQTNKKRITPVVDCVVSSSLGNCILLVTSLSASEVPASLAFTSPYINDNCIMNNDRPLIIGMRTNQTLGGLTIASSTRVATKTKLMDDAFRNEIHSRPLA